jgi:hypothetical protein
MFLQPYIPAGKAANIGNLPDNQNSDLEFHISGLGY